VATKTRSRSGARKKAASKTRTPVRQHLAPWARDALGIGLVVISLISILALWFHAAGIVGRGVSVLLHGSVGVAAVVFPALALYWGVLLIRGTVEEDRVRMFIGFLLAAVAILGVLSLARGNPRPFGGYDRVEHSAGVIGALVGWPLGKLLSKIGAVIACTGAVVLGLLIFTGTPFSTVWEWIRGFVSRGEADGSEYEDEDEEVEILEEAPSRRRRRPRLRDTQPELPIVVDIREEAQPLEDEADGEEELPVVRPALAGGKYRLPPIDLLREAPDTDADTRDEEHTVEALERTFRTFGVPARVPAAHRGPTVTLYEVEVEAGTKVNKVLSLADDIAYALATPDVRIIAPIPGKSAIGVEVPCCDPRPRRTTTIRSRWRSARTCTAGRRW
jgi:S-DNA-T family DNA segregation ATPase FtsK/SpoIIIE